MEDTIYYQSLINNTRFDSYTDLAKKHRQNEEVIFNKALDKKKGKMIECEVKIFNYESRKYEFNDKYYGSDLVNKICQDLNIVEKQYFGLQFLSRLNSSKRWLKLDDKVAKALEGRHNIILTFMFQYYPPSCEIIEDYMTIYYLIEQIKNDIRNKKLICDPDLTLLLSALYFYSRYGSYNKEMLKHILLDIDNTLEPEILRDKHMQSQFVRHYKHMPNNLTFIQADEIFLKTVTRLADYGVENYKIIPLKNRDLQINISPNGIVLCIERKTLTVKWQQFIRCSEIFGYLMIFYKNENEKKKTKIVKTFDNKFFIDTIRQNEYVYKLLQKKNTENSIFSLQLTEVHYANCPPPLPLKKNSKNHCSITLYNSARNTPPPVPKRNIYKNFLDSTLNTNDNNALKLQHFSFGKTNEYDTPPNCDECINEYRKEDSILDNDSWLHSDISSSGDESLSLYDGKSKHNVELRSIDVMSQKTLTFDDKNSFSNESIQSEDEISLNYLVNNDFYDLNDNAFICDDQPNFSEEVDEYDENTNTSISGNKFASTKFKSCIYPQKSIESKNSVNSLINTSLTENPLKSKYESDPAIDNEQSELKTFFKWRHITSLK